MEAPERYQKYFQSMSEEEYSEEVKDLKGRVIMDLPDPPQFESGGDNEEMVDQNRQLIFQTRVKVNRIDERTAFMVRLLFTMFIAFIVSAGAGILMTVL